jgi:hypothetical protein
MVGLVETMLKLHKNLPKAKTPQTAEGSRPTACGSNGDGVRIVGGGS